MENFRKIINAVTFGFWNVIDKFVADEGNINSSLSSTGPNSGYTALHFAILNGVKEDGTSIVEMLINNYHPDVNSVGADGAQPIHVACLRKLLLVTEFLLKSGADVDAELTKKHIKKLFIGKMCKFDDFGDKITLLTFAILKNYSKLAKTLLEHSANVGIKDKNNKTLLMYAVENENLRSVSLLLKNMKNNLELMNARDCFGRHAVNYLLPDEKFREFRYDRDVCYDEDRDELVTKLINARADVNAMIDDNPDTLLINKAAFRCSCWILVTLLNFNVPLSTKARPLHYLKLPVHTDKFVQDFDDTEDVEKKINECLTIILEVYTLRHEFGMFVAEEEKKLMDQLIATDPKIKEIVKNFKRNDIINFLKKNKIHYEGKSVTIYDLAVKVFDNRSLKLLVKNEELADEFQKFRDNTELWDKFSFLGEIHFRILTAYQRKVLMEIVKEIEDLRKFIPLPYEIILMIIEYLDNGDLENFKDAFYQEYDSDFDDDYNFEIDDEDDSDSDVNTDDDCNDSYDDDDEFKDLEKFFDTFDRNSVSDDDDDHHNEEEEEEAEEEEEEWDAEEEEEELDEEKGANGDDFC